MPDETAPLVKPGGKWRRSPDKDHGLIWLAGLFVLATLMLLRPVADFDFWFVRVVGRYVMEHHAIPRHEFYLYPVIGEPSQFSAWGFGLLMELVAAVGGEKGIAIFNGMLGAGTLAGLFRAGRYRTGAPAWLMLLVLAVPLACMDQRLNYRPEGSLYLALGISLVLLEKFLATSRLSLLLPIPVIAWVLAQLHTTPIVILIFLLAYLAEWWLSSRQTARDRITAALLALATLALPILNPYGFERLKVLIRSLSLPTGKLSPTIEYLPVLHTEYAPFFWALALLALAWVIRGPRRPADLILVAGCCYIAYAHARNIALFAIALQLPLVRSLAASAWPRRISPRLGITAAAIAWGGCLALMLHGHSWGFGLEPETFPEKSVAKIRAAIPSGPVFNFFHLGSYLRWQLGDRYPVAMDGHLLHHSRAEELHDAVFRADAGWEEELGRDGVKVIVTPATLPFSGAMIPLVERLADHPGWTLVETEPAALLFVATPVAAGRGLAALPRQRVWEQVLAETGKVLELYPDHVKASVARELALARLGRKGS